MSDIPAGHALSALDAAGPAVNLADAAADPAPDPGPPPPADRLVFLTTMVAGALCLAVVVGCRAAGLPMPWDKWFMATGVGLMCGGALSRVAVGLKMTGTGQNITMGGTFAAVFILMTQMPDPADQPGHGSIQILPELQDVVIRAHTPLYARRGDDRSLEFLVTQDGLDTRYWSIVGQDAARHRVFIGCLPADILEKVHGSTRRADFALVRGRAGNANESTDTIYKLQTALYPEPQGVADEAASCVQAAADRSPQPSAAAPPPRDEPTTQAGPVATISQSDVDTLMGSLPSKSLGTRTAAIATLAPALAAKPSVLARTVRDWDTGTSDYDEDLGRLLIWLPGLRQAHTEPAAARELLAALTPDQAGYLVGLVGNQDRSLRRAAREAVGWLLEAGAGSDSLPKFLGPIRANLEGPTPAIHRLETKFAEPSQPRPFLVYDLADAQLGAWCGYAPEQRRAMLDALARVPAGDVNAAGVERIAALRGRACPA